MQVLELKKIVACCHLWKVPLTGTLIHEAAGKETMHGNSKEARSD
jgi:hypothetical protein